MESIAAKVVVHSRFIEHICENRRNRNRSLQTPLVRSSLQSTLIFKAALLHRLYGRIAGIAMPEVS